MRWVGGGRVRGGADDWDSDVDVVALPDAVVVCVVVEVEVEDGVLARLRPSIEMVQL